MTILEDISSAVQRGKRREVEPLVQQAIDQKIDAERILKEGLIAPLAIVGDRYGNDEIFVPEMLVASHAMNAGVNLLKPYLIEQDNKLLGHAVVGTVKGDVHDIGKNLVCIMLEGRGITVHDLGVDVPAEKFVEYLSNHPECKVLCLSALLTTTAPMLIEVIDAIKFAGLRDRVKIMVGGAPVTQEYAEKIGADAYTSEAATAATVAAAFFGD